MFLKNRVLTRFRPLSLLCAALMVASTLSLSDISAEARSKSNRVSGRSHGASKSHGVVSSRRSGNTRARASAGRSSARGIRVSARSSRGSRSRTVVQFSGSKRRTVAVSRAGRSRRGQTIHIVRQPRPKYAYPLSVFLMHAPSFDKSPLDQATSERIARAWDRGTADSYPARALVRAGVVSYHPLRGGIFYRREPVKYIILHSTETGVPVSAVNVIEGWSSMGRRHPGAQYVVDRDGTIYQAVDPDLATVHVNIFKTLPGINNDNSIGIEMNHTGRQNYPQAQREAVNKLLAYLQQRYQVENANVVTHRYAQQGDHTDPVNFDLDGFIAYKNQFQKRALAYKVKGLEQEVKTWNAEPPAASTMLQPHPAEPAEVMEKVDRKVDRIERAEKVKVAPLPEELSRTQPVSPVNGLELKGPIEVDPSSASDLNQKEEKEFEVDGPGATKDGEKVETPKPKFAPGPDSAPEPKLSSPGAPVHRLIAPHMINQNIHDGGQPLHKESAPVMTHETNTLRKDSVGSARQATVSTPRENSSFHAETGSTRRGTTATLKKDVVDPTLTQYVPGDKVSRPLTAPVRNSPPKAIAQRPSPEPKAEDKPAPKKSVFQRMRAYWKEQFQ